MRKQIEILLKLKSSLGENLKKHVAFAFASSLFPIFFNLILALTLKSVYSIILNNTPKDIARIVIILFLSLAVLFLFNASAWSCFYSSTAKMTGNLRKAIFTHLCALPVCAAEGRHSGDIISRFSNDVQAAEVAYSQNIRYPVTAFLCGIISSIIVFNISWPMGLMILGTGILQLTFNLCVVRPLKKASDKIQAQISNVNMTLSDILSGQLTIRLNCSEKQYAGLYAKKSLELYKLNIHRAMIGSFVSSGNILLSLGSYIIVLVAGSLLVTSGHLGFPLLVFIIQMRGMMMQTVTSIGDFAIQAQPAIAGAERIIQFLDTGIEKGIT